MLCYPCNMPKYVPRHNALPSGSCIMPSNFGTYFGILHGKHNIIIYKSYIQEYVIWIFPLRRRNASKSQHKLKKNSIFHVFSEIKSVWHCILVLYSGMKKKKRIVFAPFIFRTIILGNHKLIKEDFQSFCCTNKLFCQRWFKQRLI